MRAAEDVHTDPATECFLALLEVSEAIASHRDLPGLVHELALRLPRVVSFDFLALVLHDPARNVMRLHILESRVPTTPSRQAMRYPSTSPQAAWSGGRSSCSWLQIPTRRHVSRSSCSSCASTA